MRSAERERRELGAAPGAWEEASIRGEAAEIERGPEVGEWLALAERVRHTAETTRRLAARARAVRVEQRQLLAEIDLLRNSGW